VGLGGGVSADPSKLACVHFSLKILHAASFRHCKLVPTQLEDANAFFNARLTGTRGSVIDIVSPRGIGWNPEKSEITLFGGGGGFATAKADIAANVTITVAIDAIDAVRGQPAVSVLDTMRSIVERILMATEAECRRLGFIS
jgi:hypothetical protein